MMDTCKHGTSGHCDLCDHEDKEQDSAMSEQAISDHREPIPERSVDDIPDSELLRRAVITVVRKRSRRQEFAWVAVQETFALGSTYSMQLCRRFGLDPDTGADLPNDSVVTSKSRYDGMPSSADERYLRRLLSARVAIPNAYYDDGEAQGQEHGIVIDFMRDPVADIDRKLRALYASRDYSAARMDYERRS